MPLVACVTCFNKHYVIMSWQWLCYLTITLDFTLEARNASKHLFGLSAYHKWGLVSVLGSTIQYLKAPWKQHCDSHAVEKCIYSTMFRIWKFIEGAGWWHGSTLDCEWLGPGFDSCSRLTCSQHYVEGLFHPMHKCLRLISLFVSMSRSIYSSIFHIQISIVRHWLCLSSKYIKCKSYTGDE